MIPEAAKRSMQGAAVSVIATCSADGIPNVSFLSQVWYVDPEHVALSFQFFNKTARNVAENPYAEVITIDPQTFGQWRMSLQFIRSEKEGDLFDDMDMALEAIASMTGMSGIFELKSAEIYKVLSIDHYALVNLPAGFE